MPTMLEAALAWLGLGEQTLKHASTLAPPVFVVIAVSAGGVAFGVRNAVFGRYRDAELETRGATALIGMWFRQCFAWLMRPLVSGLIRLRVSPNAITLGSFWLATLSALALASGLIALGGWLFVLAGACDFLDGRVARATGRCTSAGALLDSVVDRYVEAVVFIGLAWFYRGTWVLLAVIAALVGSLLVSYVRARGEGLGVRFSNVGLAQRPERIAVLALALVLSPIVETLIDPNHPRPIERLLIAAILFLAVTTHVTALWRFEHAYRALSVRASEPPAIVPTAALSASPGNDCDERADEPRARRVA